MSTSKSSQIYDLFHFIFFFSIDKVWERALEVAPMELHLLMWCEEVHMEHWVDTPLF